MQCKKKLGLSHGLSFICEMRVLVSYVFVFIVMDVMPLWTDEGGLLKKNIGCEN